MRIQERIDDALPDSLRASFDAHLAGCHACRRACAEARALVAALSRWERITSPPDFRARVMAALPRPLPARPAVPVGLLGLWVGLSALVAGVLALPPIWKGIARIAATGAERSAQDTALVARLFAILFASFAPVVEPLWRAARPLFAPVGAVAKAGFLAVSSIGPSEAALTASLVIAFTAGAVLALRRFLHVHERSGIHARCL